MKVIGEMNRLGMLIDLSHVSADVMRQAISASRAPVIFSHSSARALDDHPRNVPDDVLALVRQRGGVVMVNAWNDFVSPEAWAWDAVHSAEEARLKTIHRASKATVETELKAWDSAHPRPRVTISQVADHIDYVAKIAGHDHVGLGLDLDGIPYTPDGLEGVEDYPAIFAELIRRGWTDPDLAALAGGNILHTMRAAEAVAATMRNVPPSLDKLPPAP
jgi:membrane dipeptidase